jgi:hypothetical protein
MIQAATPLTSPTPPPIPTWLTASSGWVALGFLAFLGLSILYLIFTGKIDLSRLISEPNGDASMSRFQLLVFTFVIGASLFLIIAAPSPPAFPKEVPNGILILLGISASSYLVSKGIQFSSPEGALDRGPEINIVSPTTTTTAGAAAVSLKAELIGFTDTTVVWSIEPPTGLGTIDQNGTYTPPPIPAQGAKPTGTVVITVTSKQDPAISDKEVINLI